MRVRCLTHVLSPHSNETHAPGDEIDLPTSLAEQHIANGAVEAVAHGAVTHDAPATDPPPADEADDDHPKRATTKAHRGPHKPK